MLANADTAVQLKAETKPGCAASGIVSGTTQVYANLNPAELDVDAGEAFGLQVQSQAGRAATPVVLQKGASFAMNIRVNSASSPLVAYEVKRLIVPCTTLAMQPLTLPLHCISGAAYGLTTALHWTCRF